MKPENGRSQSSGGYDQSRQWGHVSRDLNTLDLPRRWLFKYYIQLLADYTSRQFTYEHDIFVAFSGILTALSGKLETSFHLGILISYFEQGLLFEVGAFSPGARRAGFPSWSWTGWNPKVTTSPALALKNGPPLEETDVIGLRMASNR
jgi:hypothetical protein